MRLGNTMLIALVLSIAGAGMSGIHAAFWLYTGLLAAALVFGVLLSLEIVAALDSQLPQRATAKGAILSMVLYAASDVYRHLSGNFVSEIPEFARRCLQADVISCSKDPENSASEQF